jgi:hypothetical protein
MATISGIETRERTCSGMGWPPLDFVADSSTPLVDIRLRRQHDSLKLVLAEEKSGLL